MNRRQSLSRERMYRYLSFAVAVVTASLIVPPDWVAIARHREVPREIRARPVDIVRLPADVLPPLPALPPKPQPTRRLAQPPVLEPPEPLPDQTEPPPLSREARAAAPRPDFAPAIPEPELPRLAMRRSLQPRNAPLAVDAPTPRLEPIAEPATARPRRPASRRDPANRLAVDAHSVPTYADLDVPESVVATSRAPAQPAVAPPSLPVARQLRTGAALRAEGAPEVDIPRGNTTRPERTAAVAAGGAVSGTRVVYDADPGETVPTATAARRSTDGAAGRPELAVDEEAPAVAYSAKAVGTALGTSAGSRTDGAGASRIEEVRAALARRYGLPLVSVHSLGQRSTEAARWNVLLPQIAELLTIAQGRADWNGAGSDAIRSVERDGERIVIRYRDGIVHVLVPTEDGLAALFVARGPQARPIVSKVEEAEQAKSALTRYTRGAS